jgi:hypothetical protein
MLMEEVIEETEIETIEKMTNVSNIYRYIRVP